MTIKPQYDSYWRLPKYESARNPALRVKLPYGRSRQMSDEEYQALMKRNMSTDRGLIIYEDCTDAELKKFVEGRLLKPMESPFGASDLPRDDIKDLRQWWRDGLIRRLTASDDSPKFSKFVNLSPELRRRVYKFYIDSFPLVLYYPSQPPLTRASRLLRNEALSMFYSHQTFALQYARTPRRGSSRFRPTVATCTFLHSLPTAQISNLRRLQLDISEWEDSPRNHAVLGNVIEIELDLSRAAIDVNRGPPSTSMAKSEPFIQKKLEDVLEDVVECEGRRRLQMSDIHAFRIAIEDGWAASKA